MPVDPRTSLRDAETCRICSLSRDDAKEQNGEVRDGGVCSPVEWNASGCCTYEACSVPRLCFCSLKQTGVIHAMNYSVTVALGTQAVVMFASSTAIL